MIAFLTQQWFSKDVCPIKMSVNFDDFDRAIANLILEMMPFKSDMLGVNCGSFTVC